MKKSCLILLLFVCVQLDAQSVFGYWYGSATVQSSGTANNYLLELVLKPEKGYVSGVFNYYFKNQFRSMLVKGNYDASGRILTLYDISIPYHKSNAGMEIECQMNFKGSLRVAKAGSNLIGLMTSLPAYKYTCTDLSFNLAFNADASKQDSVLRAIREFKEENQVWTPGKADTLTAVRVIQRKVTNYFIENQYKQREKITGQEISVGSPTISLDFYDNGEVDGDSISVFFNDQLLAFSQKLGTRSIHFDIALDSTKEVNEITMFADNLGSIPPNTALMIVTDGDKQYDIRLSSSLEKSATLRIRRKEE
ncbi:MAG: hypothetical protein EOO09_19800 [Chitinophagaceae bacterium]|nr:MAG: hypothetical protein EOO09_19800 [Chitinophagaceae bacterium]